MSAFSKGWIPVRRGKIYCSPRCGCGCTHVAFELATRRAAKLARRLGAGWSPRVWENCGWHYEVINGKLEVHVGYYVTGTCFSCWYQGSPQIITDKSHKKPEAAIAEVAVEMRKRVRAYQREIASMRKLI